MDSIPIGAGSMVELMSSFFPFFSDVGEVDIGMGS